jgi:hypothetical protein
MFLGLFQVKYAPTKIWLMVGWKIWALQELMLPKV